MFFGGCRLKLDAWREGHGYWMAAVHTVLGQDTLDVLHLVDEQGTRRYVMSHMYSKDPGGLTQVRGFESQADCTLDRVECCLIIPSKELVINVDWYDDNR